MAGSLRREFRSELDQLRLQVEVMGVRVDENLERMRTVLAGGGPEVVVAALAADDEIDAMHVSLTQRCYLLLGRESPVATDLRFVVSVLRILAELERIGDLSLRVIKLQPEVPTLASAAAAWDILCSLSDEAVERYRTALRAWSSQDAGLAGELASSSRDLDLFSGRLLAELMRLDRPDAVPVAISIFTAERAVGRIADHATIVAARLRYLLTGEPAHLAEEIR